MMTKPEQRDDSDDLKACPFCGGKATKSPHSESVICDCLRASNTWVPVSVWQNRRQANYLMAAFSFDLLQCSQVQLRVMSRRLLHPTESVSETADATGISRRSVGRTLADMTTRWPELRRIFSHGKGEA